MSHPLQPLSQPPGAPGRYTSRPLPRYRHVPGLTPHPVNHPAGHSFAVPEPRSSESCRNLPAAWSRCEEYLYGVDLFNRSFLWEAHEAWEVVWIGAGKQSEPGVFVQGLIQTAASQLRLHLGTPAGARNLARKAGRRFDLIESRIAAAGDTAYMGIALEPWRRAVERFRTRNGPYPFLRLE